MKFSQTGRINFRPWRRDQAKPIQGMPRRSSGVVDMIVAVDTIGDSNIYPKVRCMPVLGRQGAPMRDPDISFTEKQLACANEEFENARLILRYASLAQVMRRSGASLHIPQVVEQGELASSGEEPTFRLVAWGPRGDASQVRRRLKRARLVDVGASLTTGLSTLLLSRDAVLGEDEQLKLRLRSGAAVVRRIDGMWCVNLAQAVVQAPPMFDLRPF